MKKSLTLMFLLCAAAGFAAYDATKPADTELVSDVPAAVRENFRALKEDRGVDAGYLEGARLASITGQIPNNASFTLAGLSEKSYWSLTGLPTFGTMASETATTYLKVADLPPYPTNASFTLAGLSEKSYWSLTDHPTFGTMASESATDYLKEADVKSFETLASEATGNATFSYTFDVATLTINGEDVLGDVQSALAGIIGE